MENELDRKDNIKRKKIKLDFGLVDSFVTHLDSYEEATFKALAPTTKQCGLIIEDDSELTYSDKGNEWAAGIMRASVLGDDLMASSYIANTINSGFRHIGCDESGKIIDIGPVVTPCIIGNAEKPQGMFIPFTYFGVNEGIECLNKLRDRLEAKTENENPDL